MFSKYLKLRNVRGKVIIILFSSFYMNKMTKEIKTISQQKKITQS